MVIELGLSEAEDKNGFKTSIDELALKYIAMFSEGYPHFLQQYAYSAFEADTDNNITNDDVFKGLLDENGALHQLGIRYFDSMYFKEIYSEDYRKILQVMASHDDAFISKRDIVSKTGLKDYTIQNAVSAFLKKGILTIKPGTRGMYMLSSNSFKAWILTFTNAATVRNK